MYLKALEMKGFKSFLDKTVVNFPRGMISIVGPNGSGKSNILDAVRWVLGEQSIKALRGDKLEDVIFSGTQDKPPVGVCEVTLVLDNEDGTLDTSYSEVAIKRKAYRSGESKFYINDKACRLKDIKELLLDTGIGKEGYSIISQGKIDEIVGSSSTHKRTLLEEASGITKYRYKKEEGEKNLEIATENLERITDVYKEIQMRVKPLEEQKQKAQAYIQLKDRLKKYELNKYIQVIDEIEQKNSELSQKKAELLDELSSCDGKVKDYEGEIEKLVTLQSQMEREKDSISEEIQEKKSYLNSKEGHIAVKNETIKNLNLANQMLSEQISKSQEKIQEKKDYIDEIQGQNEGKKEQLNVIVKEMSTLKDTQEHLKQEIVGLRDALRKDENEKSDLQSDLTRLQARIQFQQTNIDSFKEKIAEYEQRQKDIKGELISLQEAIEKGKNHLSTCERRHQVLKKSAQELNLELESKQNVANESTQRQNNLSLEMKKISSETEVLKRLDQSMEGFSRGIKAILRNKKLPGICDIVANVIRVKPGYEKAIEQLISGRMDNIIIQRAKDSSFAIDFLKKNNLGRATFLPMDTIRPSYLNYNDLGVKAIDVVDYEDKYNAIVQNILGKMVIVEDLSQGLAISKKYSHSFRIATKKGEIFNVGGSITGGSLQYTRDVFSRRSNIANNEGKIKKIIEEIKVEEQKERSILAEKKILQQNLEQLKKDVEESLEDITKASSYLVKLNAQLDLTKDKQKMLDEENQRLTYSDIRARQSLAEDEKKVMALKDGIDQLEGKISKTTSSLEQKEQSQSDVISKISQKNIEISTLRQDATHVSSNIQSATRDMKVAESEREDAINKQRQNSESIAEAELEIENLTGQIKTDEVKIKEVKEKLLKLEQDLDSHKESIRQKRSILETLGQNVSKLSSKITQCNAEIEKANYKLDLIFGSIYENYEMKVDQIYPYKDETLHFTDEDIKGIKSEIISLGNVNLDSIEEFERVNERYLFYQRQKEDLEDSIEKLRQIIRHLEKDMIADFKSSFDVINENFGKIFSLLFGGGKARLILTDEDDVLGSDIELTVQPPGKKLKSISMLSGGEKALSAIALLFAIISQKAVPFCILDEIDAPLDDENIYRFLKYLSTLKDTTQFITITHRRNTMEASDYLYAVFMQEKGVSEVVSISLMEISNYAED